MVQTLSEIKSLLAAHGLRPRRRFAQNFLHDANQMRRILEAAELEPDELVLEVGPGTGALSESLLEAGARLVMVEIDRDLEAILREHVLARWPGRANLVMADVLAGKRRINPAVFEALAAQDAASSSAPRPSTIGNGQPPVAAIPFKLIANLPYNIASPLLANLAVDHPEMPLAVVMLQREVADRLTAAPGGKDYGPLGVLLQAICHVQRVATLPPSCFWPQPEVDSAVVRLRRREQPLTRDPHALGAMLQTLFTKRRKQLGAILGRTRKLPPGIDARVRPEQLTVEQLVLLAESRAEA